MLLLALKPHERLYFSNVLYTHTNQNLKVSDMIFVPNLRTIPFMMSSLVVHT